MWLRGGTAKHNVREAAKILYWGGFKEYITRDVFEKKYEEVQIDCGGNYGIVWWWA